MSHVNAVERVEPGCNYGVQRWGIWDKTIRVEPHDCTLLALQKRDGNQTHRQRQVQFLPLAKSDDLC
jgi:hypothetical protein